MDPLQFPDHPLTDQELAEMAALRNQIQDLLDLYLPKPLQILFADALAIGGLSSKAATLEPYNRRALRVIAARAKQKLAKIKAARRAQKTRLQ